MSTKRCDECVFSYIVNPPQVLCRRLPPTAHMFLRPGIKAVSRHEDFFLNSAIGPSVPPDHWCGEFKSKFPESLHEQQMRDEPFNKLYRLLEDIKAKL